MEGLCPTLAHFVDSFEGDNFFHRNKMQLRGHFWGVTVELTHKTPAKDWVCVCLRIVSCWGSLYTVEKVQFLSTG